MAALEARSQAVMGEMTKEGSQLRKCKSRNESSRVSCTEGVVTEQSKKVDEQASECEVDVGEGCSQNSGSFEVVNGSWKTEDEVKRGECSHMGTVMSGDEDIGNETVTEEWIGERSHSWKGREECVKVAISWEIIISDDEG